MFGKLGAGELILILCIALVIFGPSKLPQIGKSMGEAIKEFRKGTTSVQKEINELIEDEPTTKK
ncbi:MAG: twin-arginine translocase TatA/TatE family subunit [Turicibacter sp.]